MQTCRKCGRPMKVNLRTVVYSGKAEIENVPVVTCSFCYVSEVLREIKADLTELISTLDGAPERKLLRFDDYNELACLMKRASERDMTDVPMQEIVEERVDQLLDLMILAKSLNDSAWVADIERRLRQIANVIMAI